MSSRSGARAKGTDGSDFGHREKVASHYQISSQNKSRLKTTLFLHVLLFVFELAKLSPKILAYFDVSLKQYINITLPQPALWEWAWLASIVFALPALHAVQKNSITFMKVYLGGIFATAILPLAFAIAYHSGELSSYIKSEESKVERFFGVPVVLVTAGFVGFAFLVHSLSLVFAKNLMDAWAPKKGKKKS
ncbi:protein jagunal-like isoform X2 [Uloborus diversus]|uniref:protein jagunal-like isoform X1 n=1 Tax=Uloborus diversus TaxID=327109 RepID=UPI00240A0FB0|nr:protein jagunal-like isoform X1 [Uloborus diversus]XP_054722857.1 protein jagunal-like isoform X2 [Uloborus diversus]